jgi:sugar lactone lactonase YvrE
MIKKDLRMQQFEAIADYQDLCGEGPLWDSTRNLLYWTDLSGRRFYCYEWLTKRSTVLRAGLEICGFALNEPIGFVLANSDGLWTWDGSDEPILLADEVDGHPCRMNDCIADPQGRLLAGSCLYESNREDYPLGHLMRVDHDGSVHILDDGIRLANGLGFSPDGRTLYFSDSADRVIYAYDYDVERGEVRHRRPFVRTPLEEGLPDGLTVDAEGFIWSAQWFGSCVMRYDPDGRVERKIPVPAKQTSSVAFGGPDLTDLFVTSAGLGDSLPLAPPDYDPHHGYIGGKLFLANLEITGKPEFRCRIHGAPSHATRGS